MKLLNVPVSVAAMNVLLGLLRVTLPLALVLPASAEARLTYVRGDDAIYVARDDGSQAAPGRLRDRADGLAGRALGRLSAAADDGSSRRGSCGPPAAPRGGSPARPRCARSHFTPDSKCVGRRAARPADALRDRAPAHVGDRRRDAAASRSRRTRARWCGRAPPGAPSTTTRPTSTRARSAGRRRRGSRATAARAIRCGRRAGSRSTSRRARGELVLPGLRHLGAAARRRRRAAAHDDRLGADRRHHLRARADRARRRRRAAARRRSPGSRATTRTRSTWRRAGSGKFDGRRSCRPGSAATARPC